MTAVKVPKGFLVYDDAKFEAYCKRFGLDHDCLKIVLPKHSDRVLANIGVTRAPLMPKRPARVPSLRNLFDYEGWE